MRAAFLRIAFVRGVSGVLLACIATLAMAQSGYPRKPILMLVPLQAASAVDNAARIVAQKMADNMGQPIPDVPTIGESGVPGFEFGSFFALVAPAGTPKDIVARLNAEVVKAAAAPEVREKLVAQGFSVMASSPEVLNCATRDQLDRYGKLFKQVGIEAE